MSPTNKTQYWMKVECKSRMGITLVEGERKITVQDGKKTPVMEFKPTGKLLRNTFDNLCDELYVDKMQLVRDGRPIKKIAITIGVIHDTAAGSTGNATYELTVPANESTSARPYRFIRIDKIFIATLYDAMFGLDGNVVFDAPGIDS